MTTDSNPSDATGRRNPTTRELLDRISEIARHQPFKSANVKPLLADPSLGLAPARSTEYFAFFHSAESATTPMFSKVEIRVPTSGSDAEGGIVVLELAATTCVKQSDVGDRFGHAPPRPSPPPPHGAVDALVYDLFPQDWGVVRLGYSPSTSCLVMVVLDATE